MFTNSNSRGKCSHKDFNLGVIIIFIIVTLIFAFSLSQSSFGKKILSHKTDFSDQERIVSLN
jgi:hypothetical protein